MTLLDRWFKSKPKWQSPDPLVRKEAIKALNDQDGALVELARADQDPGVRRTALGRVNDLGLLLATAREDSEAGVREYAQARFRNLMVGREADSPPLATRLAMLTTPLPAGMADFLAQHGIEPELRLAALDQVHPESLLGDIACDDPSAQVRLAALVRIHSIDILERVAKHARNRDKRVSRLARERFAARSAELHQAARSREICAELETLPWEGETGASAARFAKLEEEWRHLEPQVEPEMQARYRQAHERYMEHFRASAARRAQRLALCKQLETWLAESPSMPDDATIEAFQQLLRQARTEWQATGAVDDTEGRRLERQFQQAIQALEDRHQLYERERERFHQHRVVLDRGDALLHQASAVLDADLDELRQRWERLPHLESKALQTQLQGQYDAILARLRNRTAQQAQQKDQELHAIEGLLADLEQALENGESQHAMALHEQAEQRLKTNISLTRRQMEKLSERLQASTAQITELRSWRRWGANQAREKLCAEAQALIGSSDDPPDLARQIQALRNAWKALDGKEGMTAPKLLWNRFNEACESAYAPCQAYFSAQAAERQSNLASRQALCERIEQFILATDWGGSVDWRAVDRFEREARKEWHAQGPVNRADRSAIENRYREAMEHLESHLRPQREQELQRRRALIKRVQALADSDDIRSAVDAVKKAQAEWQPRISIAPRQEQTLWKQFRAACDEIFARRAAEQQTLDAERQANLEHKNALCADIERLTDQVIGGNDAEAHAAHERYRQIQQQWEDIGATPKTAQTSLATRFAVACKAFEKAERQRIQNQLRGEMDALGAHARLCHDLEVLLANASAADADIANSARERRQTLPALGNNRSAEALQQRFERICAALAEDADKRAQLLRELHENHASKRELCVRMEIAAGVDSPTEFAQERMAYQIARLSASLQQRDSTAQIRQQANAIEREWYAMGSLPADQDEALEARFQRALQALLATSPTG